MVFGYKFDLYTKSDDKPISSEDETQCCIINLVDDWNLVTNSTNSSKNDIKSPYINDLSQDSWDDSIHASGYDFNQSYRNDSTAYGSSSPDASDPSELDRSEGGDLVFDDIEYNFTSRLSDRQSQIKMIDQLVNNLIKNISVLGLYMYYLESSEGDSVTLDDFKVKLEETSQIIEQIRMGINSLIHCSGKNKGVLPQVLISKLKQNLSLYNNILVQYHHYVKTSFTNEASSIYPNKSLDQVRLLLEDFDKGIDVKTPQKIQISNEEKENIIKYLQDKARDIEYLEQRTSNLNRVYQELYNVLSKRGEQLSSLEHQILISSGCIDRGKMDIEKAYKYKKSSWKRLIYFASLIIITCILLALPNIIPYFFDNSRVI